MISFTELISEMQEDMNDQQNKIDTFARTMFQWLDRISLSIDPTSTPSEFSTCPDSEVYFNESSSAIAQVSEQASFLSQAEFDISMNSEDTESFHFQPSHRSSIKQSDENSKIAFNVNDNKNKKVFFSENKITPPEKKNDSRPYYFGIEEYVDELSENAMKFIKNWQNNITTQREP